MLDPAYSTANRFVDSDHPAVLSYAREHGVGATARERVVALYYAVRDGFRYNPWNVTFEPEHFSASHLLLRDRSLGGHCVDKATLLAACARAIGVPSRLHFANVRNHIGTARLEAHLGTDLLVYHGYTELWLGERWVAATPAFNRELCERLAVAPLEFDGVEDSVFQAYDRGGGQFMEYVTDHGVHAEIPVDAMVAAWRLHYPAIMATGAWPRPTSQSADR
ncbi:transglutaminase-like domain-containing protein [Enhygromyxa salina]|uniref:Transglutaminase-like superfamily protein n=1 Tax=Enhygromyxa salina TaxID=215803 RepID=A0A2S9Y817_9BACT|nr:transglutaminase family protein [Enhygromyxa salina]PRQ01202.1 Transglutaminase-like superfamily protein [Enhygromyxa salina]